MTSLLWVAGAWLALSVPAALFTGRTVHLADEQSEAEREATKRRHPSWRGAA